MSDATRHSHYINVVLVFISWFLHVIQIHRIYVARYGLESLLLSLLMDSFFYKPVLRYILQE